MTAAALTKATGGIARAVPHEVDTEGSAGGNIAGRAGYDVAVRFHCFQHGASEPPGLIGEWIEERGHTLTTTALYEPHRLPAPEEFDALVVMGGHMGAYDEKEFPWLKSEKLYLQRAIAAGKQVLGICLGAQLIAGALGARVYKGPEQEIGWWPIEWNEQARTDRLFEDFDRLDAFQWHGDTFELPDGATLLASSLAYPNQAFRYGQNVIAFQFHPEVDDAIVGAWIEQSLAEIPPDRFVQKPEEMLRQDDRLARQGRFLRAFLERFFSM